MWNSKNIFEPSGCISREALEAFVSGNLPDDIIGLINAHLAECEFCSDAIEGFNVVKDKSNITAILQKTDTLFFNLKEANTKDKVNKRLLWTAVSAAASVLIIVGIFRIINSEKPVQQIAENISSNKDSVKVELAQKSQAETTTSFSTEIEKDKPVRKVERPVQTITNDELRLEESVSKKKEMEEPVVPLQISDQVESKTIAATSDTLEAAMDIVYNANNKVESPAPKASASGVSNRKSLSVRSETGFKSAEYSDEAFMEAELSAKFMGGDVSDFQKYIQNQIAQIIDTAKAVKIIAGFTVNEKGRTEDVKIIKGSRPEYNSLIIKKIMQSPKWMPAIQYGKPAKSQLTISVLIQE